MMKIKRLNSKENTFWSQLDQLLAWDKASDDAVFQTVNGILNDVRQRGDSAVVEYTNRFDRMSVTDMAALDISSSRQQKALQSITAVQREILEFSAERIKTLSPTPKT